MEVKEIKLYKDVDKLQQALGNTTLLSQNVKSLRKTVMFPDGDDVIYVCMIYVDSDLTGKEIFGIFVNPDSKNMKYPSKYPVSKVKKIMESYFKVEKVDIKIEIV